MRRASFQHTVISELTQLKAAGLERWMALADGLRNRLKALQYAHESLDLEASVTEYVESNFGPAPPGAGLAGVVEQAAREFEMQLYRDYYKDSIRYYIEIRKDPYRAQLRVEGLPKRVQKRMLDITGYSDISGVMVKWGMRPFTIEHESRSERRKRRRRRFWRPGK